MRPGVRHALLGTLVALATIALSGPGTLRQPVATTLDRIHAAMQARVDRQQLAGAVTLVGRCGTTVFHDAVGFQDIEARLPMRDDTLFFIASMTKPVTSVAAMMLYEAGKLRLDDAVSKFIPSFSSMRVLGPDGTIVPARRPITIADLLTHRSGLTYGFSDGPVAARYRTHGINDGLMETTETLAENVDRLAREPLAVQPGTTFRYGLSVDVLGRVIEIASGLSLDAFFRRRIFEPLRMRDTYFYVPDAKAARVAVLYTAGENGGLRPIRRGDKVLNDVVESVVRRGSSRYFSGGAGLISTAADYARFATMLLRDGELDGTRVLTPGTIRLMTTSHTSDLDPPPFEHAQFGFGFQIEIGNRGAAPARSPGAFSWSGIWGTAFWVDPRERLVAVLMTQRFPGVRPDPTAEFERLVYEAVLQPSLPRARPGC